MGDFLVLLAAGWVLWQLYKWWTKEPAVKDYRPEELFPEMEKEDDEEEKSYAEKNTIARILESSSACEEGMHDQENRIPLKKTKERLSIVERIKRARSDLELNEQLIHTLTMMEETSQNIFVTGKAGTGKSTLLRLFKEFTDKNVVVVAPTGVAAINAGGMTIHSFFQLPLGAVNEDDVKILSRKKEVFEKMDTLIIDEISMVRADLLDAIDMSMRRNRRNWEPFGGAQVLLFGDLYQLPPVVDDREIRRYLDDKYNGCYYFFGSRAYRETAFQRIELMKVFRQTDADFIEILNKIRKAEVADYVLEAINKRAGILPPENMPVITLTTRRLQAEMINKSELEKLPGEAKVYNAEIKGRFDARHAPADYQLRLKEGAQVMLVKNDSLGRWVNGTLGVVEELGSNQVKVAVDGHSYWVKPAVWENLDYYYDENEKKIKSRIIGTFTQIPLKLAWAITIHKSQGKTFSQVVVDLGEGAFEYGQVYVALSRCRSLKGLYLKTPVRHHEIKVHPQVVDFEKEFALL